MGSYAFSAMQVNQIIFCIGKRFVNCTNQKWDVVHLELACGLFKDCSWVDDETLAY